MPEAIIVLHISDMQFGKFHRFAEKSGNPPNSRDTLAARLTADLQRLATQNQLRPDLIICTGDLAEWGMAKEFADAFAFLSNLCEHYGLLHNRCIVIPGNHDINRSNCEAYFSECKGDGETPIFPYFPKWKHYKTAFDAFYAGFSGITFDSETPWSLFINDDLRVVVAGLNSTMDEAHDAAVNAEEREDKGHHGLCTESQLDWFKKRLSEPRFEGWLRIGAVHHNSIRGCRSDDENLRDADLLGGILGDHLHLLLHGHTHEAKSDMLAAKVRVYSTGSASLKTSSETAPVPTDVPNQYQFLAIERGSITRYCRQYAPRNTPPEFIADVRQSTTKHDWIIKDDVNFRDVHDFNKKVKAESHQEKTQDSTSPPIDIISTPLAFYAEPDYIGSHQFVGRKAELDALSDWANRSDPTNLLLFEAIGGNGKSMLTWEWTTRHSTSVRSDWAGRFWYSFYERGAIMQDFCQRALSYMTGRPLKRLEKLKTAEMKDELIALLHSKPWLLILDGLERVLVAYHRIDAGELPDEEANTPTDKILNRNPCDAIRDEDNDLLRALAACAPSKILVSSRLTPRVLLNPAGQPIPGAKRITLLGLRPADAEALLRQCGIVGDSSAMQDYLRQNCDNHPLVIGILAGLIANYLPDRYNFDAWSIDPSGGASLDLSKLNLIQRRNHILHSAITVLPEASRQILSTLAFLFESVDYDTLEVFNPHLPPEPFEVAKPEPPAKKWRKEQMTEEQKIQSREQYKAECAKRKEYENALRSWRKLPEVREAPLKLGKTIRDLEQRGLLQYDSRDRRYDLHPVVRGVAAGGMKSGDKERYGQRVLDYFSAQPKSPWDQVRSLKELSPAENIVRTFLRLGRFQDAACAYLDGCSSAHLFNLEAHVDILSFLRVFFPENWGELPQDIESADAQELANTAGIALHYCGELEDAFAAFNASLEGRLGSEDWSGTLVQLGNIAENLALQNQLAKTLRVHEHNQELSSLRGDEVDLFRSRFLLFADQSRVGDWQSADASWKQLDPMGRYWPRNLYRGGDAEFYYARWQYWQGTLMEKHLENATRLAFSDNNRYMLRNLHQLRGAWQMDQEKWELAVVSFQEAVRMARERRLIDPESETGLILAKLRISQLTRDDARSEALRVAQFRQPAHRYLAMLWLAIGNVDEARCRALDAYKWAWADGEPYVNRYELTKTTELLQQMNLEIPNLPPYDPAKDEHFPWEADLRLVIERLREKMEKKREVHDQTSET
jgi:3',5'-cyclic AMP phosphodiesterase CpdA